MNSGPVQTLSSKQPTFGLLCAEEAQDGGDVDNNTSVAAPRSVHLARLCMHELGMRREQYSVVIVEFQVSQFPKFLKF